MTSVFSSETLVSSLCPLIHLYSKTKLVCYSALTPSSSTFGILLSSVIKGHSLLGCSKPYKFIESSVLQNSALVHLFII